MKTTIKNIGTGLLAALLVALPATRMQAQSAGSDEWTDQYRNNYEIPLGNYTGKSPFMRSSAKPAPPAAKPAPAPVMAKPAPAPAPAPAPREGYSTATTDCGLVKLTKSAPSVAALGENITYTLTAVAQCDVADVVVTDMIPAGSSYVSSDPAAAVDGKTLVWKVASLNRGESRTMKVTVKADAEGELVNCATVTAVPKVCISTLVGKPNLAITKTGPATALINSDVTYTVTVMNKGNITAKNVVVTDAVPKGMSGNPVTVNVGDLGPNQSKTMPVTFKATQRGKVCNVAEATSSNAGKVNAEACTVIEQPGVKITKEGPKEQFLGRHASYNIVVSNTGDTRLTGVVVTDTAPAATTIVDAGGGSVNGKNITWNVGELAAGATKSFTVVLTTETVGTHCNNVAVNTANGLRDSAEACTVWKGISALLLEKGDNPDPIQVGEETTYYVRVTNQGTAADTNVKVVVEFPKELTPVSADNGGTISGKTVTFPAFPRLAPKQAFEYHVKAKGAQAGDARVTFIRTSTDIPAPTSAEESTRVY